MTHAEVGILHPGAMGVSIAANIKACGSEVYWVSAGRSAATADRAREHGLSELNTLQELCDNCQVLVSVCPPHAALEQAQLVKACSFEGAYVDANAISPQTVEQLVRLFADTEITFTDGGIIGGPAWQADSCILSLSGPDADAFVGQWGAHHLVCQSLGPEVGRASALKMCFAAWTKGQTAMLAAVHAAAEGHGVLEDLQAIWNRGDQDVSEKHAKRLSNVTAKAWRFAGEMREIAETFEEASIPGGFYEAAAETYERLALFKDDAQRPDLEAVLAALLHNRS